MDIWSLILQVATLSAVVVAAWQLLFHSRQMHRDFEALYVARYWTLMDQRSRGYVLSGRLNRADRIVVLSYLQLCEDEIDCRRIGRVTDSTWKFWRSSIVAQASETASLDVLRSLPEGRFPQLRALLRDPVDHDPLAWNWLGRAFHGL